MQQVEAVFFIFVYVLIDTVELPNIVADESVEKSELLLVGGLIRLLFSVPRPNTYLRSPSRIHAMTTSAIVIEV